jgi:hypothetical protein
VPVRIPVIFLFCVVAHVVMDGVIPSSWWVPDLTLVGLVVATARAPARWLLWSGLAGLVVSVWAARFAAAVFGGYLILGWGLRALAKRWDTTDLRLECLLVAGGVFVLTAGLAWLDGAWSPLLFGLVMGRAAMTTLTLLVMRTAVAEIRA